MGMDLSYFATIYIEHLDYFIYMLKESHLIVYQYYNSKTPKYISHIISVLLEFLIALLSLIIIWCKHLS